MAEAHTFAPLTDPNPQGKVARCIFEARDVFMWMRAGATHARLAICVEAAKVEALALALDSRSICLWRKKAKQKNSVDDGIVRVNERHQSVLQRDVILLTSKRLVVIHIFVIVYEL